MSSEKHNATKPTQQPDRKFEFEKHWKTFYRKSADYFLSHKNQFSLPKIAGVACGGHYGRLFCIWACLIWDTAALWLPTCLHTGMLIQAHRPAKCQAGAIRDRLGGQFPELRKYLLDELAQATLQPTNI